MRIVQFLFVSITLLVLSLEASKPTVTVDFIDEGASEITLDIKTKPLVCKDTLWKLPFDLPHFGSSIYHDYFSPETTLGKGFDSAAEGAKTWVHKNFFNGKSQDNTFVINEDVIEEKLKKNIRSHDFLEDVKESLEKALGPIFPTLSKSLEQVNIYYDDLVENIKLYLIKAKKELTRIYYDVQIQYAKFQKKQKVKQRLSPLLANINRGITEFRKILNKNFPASIQIEQIIYKYYLDFLLKCNFYAQQSSKVSDKGCEYVKSISRSNAIKALELESKNLGKSPRNTESRYYNCRVITKYGSKVNPASDSIHEQAQELVRAGNYSELILGYKIRDKQNRVYLKLVC